MISISSFYINTYLQLYVMPLVIGQSTNFNLFRTLHFRLANRHWQTDLRRFSKAINVCFTTNDFHITFHFKQNWKLQHVASILDSNPH